jgi:hypothetical protein
MDGEARAIGPELRHHGADHACDRGIIARLDGTDEEVGHGTRIQGKP